MQDRNTHRSCRVAACLHLLAATSRPAQWLWPRYTLYEITFAGRVAIRGSFRISGFGILVPISGLGIWDSGSRLGIDSGSGIRKIRIHDFGMPFRASNAKTPSPDFWDPENLDLRDAISGIGCQLHHLRELFLRITSQATGRPTHGRCSTR